MYSHCMIYMYTCVCICLLSMCVYVYIIVYRCDIPVYKQSNMYVNHEFSSELKLAVLQWHFRNYCHHLSDRYVIVCVRDVSLESKMLFI